jgi:IclR family transcriptional regulator, KDG regulon repressor
MRAKLEDPFPKLVSGLCNPNRGRAIGVAKSGQNIPSNSLDRALMVLQRIEQSRGGLTNSEVSRELGIATSSCSYILSRLEKRGYLSRDSPSGKYRIGLTVLSLAHGVLRDLGFRSLAEPTLYRLVSESGLSASIGVIERRRLVFVDRLESPKFLSDAVHAQETQLGRKSRWSPNPKEQIRGRELRDIGRELPLHSNAPGKMILAHLPQADVLTILKEVGLEQCTPHTIVSESELLDELETIRKRGWAASYEEQYSGISAIAAPIFGADGEISAAVSLNGSSSDSLWQNPGEIVQMVTVAAREISNRARMR